MIRLNLLLKSLEKRKRLNLANRQTLKAKKLLEDINTMKAMQQALNYKDDLEMLENKVERGKNQEILQESVENANECVNECLKTSQLWDTIDNCDSLWNLSVNGYDAAGSPIVK